MKTIRDFKDRFILFGWLAVLLLVISLILIFTQPLQTYYLLRTVNNVFINNNDARRISSYIPQRPGRTGILGYWYSMYNSSDTMFVFTLFQDGILVPLGAIVSAEGEVEEIIPLSAHAEQVFDNLPAGILNIYTAHIEAAASAGGNSR